MIRTIRNISVILASLVLAFTACVKEETVTVEFKEQAYGLNVGETLNLASELVISGSDQKPSFTSSDASVAAVNASGLVTALAAGEVTVTASAGGVSATCLVRIAEVKAASIVLTFPEMLPADETWGTVRAEVTPAGYDMDNLVWTFTPSADNVAFEQTKVSASEYKVRFTSFVEGGKLTVKVADRNSSMEKTAVIEMVEKMIPATRISLTMPDKLTAGEGIWAEIKAEVTPEDYDPDFLEWAFKPSNEALAFTAEKISASEYKVSFTSYVSGASLEVLVTDRISNVMGMGSIKVLERPKDGLRQLSLSPATLVLTTDSEPVTLNPVYEPADYDTALLEWTSSDETVASVDAGVVTVKAEGETVVKIKDTVSGKEAVCKVIVTAPGMADAVNRIDLSQTNLSLRVGEESVQLTARCYDIAGELIENYAGLEWSAAPMVGEHNNEITVVEVSQQGVVTPKNAGSTQIVVTDKNNTFVKATCYVTVAPAEIKVTEVKVTPASKVVRKGENFTLETRVIPDDAENKALTYRSSDESVATVTGQGVVTGVKAGKAVITVSAANGVYGTCDVVVADEIWVYLSETQLSMFEGDEKQITAQVTPEDAPDKTVVWASSDESVATVNDGLIKAVKEGEAVITATFSGVTAECKVTVMAENVDFDITIEPSDRNILTQGLMQDKTVRLNAYYMRTEDRKDYIPVETSWKSSDETIATVDAEGNVTAVIEHIDASGFENGRKVTITHIVDHKQASVEITVVKALPEQVIMTAVPSVDGVEYRMMHRESFTFKAKVLPEKANQEVWFAGGEYLQMPNNTFTANTVGDVQITAYAADNTSVPLRFTITVLPVVLTDMTMSNQTLDMVVGGQASLNVTFTPAEASYTDLDWTSSDESVVTVDAHGNLVALAAGTAVITAAQEENGMSCTCSVNVTEPVASYKVGDYYYSTGKVSSSPDEDEAVYGKVIGVIFSLDNPSQMGDARLTSDHPDCVNGYVVSTVEYTDLDFGSVSAYNGHGYYAGLGYDADAIVDQDKANGYGNTLAHAALNASKSDYCLMFNQETGVIATHSAAVAAPETSSAWYVPSYKEMMMLVANADAVNAALTAAGGTPVAEPYASEVSWDDNRSSDWYWTSTIHGTWYERGQSYDHAKYPFDISKNGWTTYTQSSATCRARVILAF